MIQALDAMNGQKWARFTLIGALLVSIGYNVANICLTETDVHVLLRIPQGIVWPAFLFLGIEVMIRNKDLDSSLARVARIFLMGVTIPTAVTSYINLHDFMMKANEPGVAQISGPLAIDGLMLGCTLYLLASRYQPEPEPVEVAEAVEVAQPVEVAEVTEVAEKAPVTPRAPRARSVDWDMRQVAELAADGVKAAQIHTLAGVSLPVASRFTRVAKILRADPSADIDSAREKVRPEAVRIMRELIAR